MVDVSTLVRNVQATSGKRYGLGQLLAGELQYMDRDYRFYYVPDDLRGSLHLMTHGDDKLIDEASVCVSFEVGCDVDVFVLYADKFPVLPTWLSQDERTRYNVTRQDSRSDNLKGYFGLYRRSFAAGLITLRGCSPRVLLTQDWFAVSMGADYCMYTVAVLPKAEPITPS